MPSSDIDILPQPRPCKLCGLPTTQFSRSLGAPYCGREELGAPGRKASPHGQFQPPMRGGRRPWWRRRAARRSAARL